MTDGPFTALILPYFDNNIVAYRKSNPNLPMRTVKRLVCTVHPSTRLSTDFNASASQIIEFVSAIVYLHGQGIFLGNIHGVSHSTCFQRPFVSLLTPPFLACRETC